MINASTLLDAYLDVNVLLLLVCVLWFVFSRVLDRLGFARFERIEVGGLPADYGAVDASAFARARAAAHLD